MQPLGAAGQHAVLPPPRPGPGEPPLPEDPRAGQRRTRRSLRLQPDPHPAGAGPSGRDPAERGLLPAPGDRPQVQPGRGAEARPGHLGAAGAETAHLLPAPVCRRAGSAGRPESGRRDRAGGGRAGAAGAGPGRRSEARCSRPRPPRRCAKPWKASAP